MLNVGLWEFGVIFVVLLLVLGPKQLPHVAKITGIWLGKMRRLWENTKHEINQGLDEGKDDASSHKDKQDPK